MPLNKLENFIKNAEGRILYVNPNDLDSTDGIENQGNSLTKPFKTIQRALIEAARFSYIKGDDNDFVERTTILLFPGEHIVDNRPGFGIKSEAGQARAVSPGGITSGAINTLTLTLDSNFDLTQENNILYKFNSVNGGVIVPRGTSIVGLDLRKTKIRPKYVPNPTFDDIKHSAIFRITGACYFWQFTLFDGNELETVYTHPEIFSSIHRSKPTFSHHKLTCFEYADGITKLPQYSDLTDLDIYYSKLSNAYNKASANREITQKYPSAPKGFAPQRPEFEIVGAFATDPLNISSLESGDGSTPGQVVTVKTALPHNLTGGTPIKIRGVEGAPDYNISTKVSTIINDTTFTYLLPFVRANLAAGSRAGVIVSNAQVLVETDTVSGASPYIFNCSMRSVYGMQGMHADGKKATGFKSMVVAQFTAVSLQKDDRAFVKYDKTNRKYSGITFEKRTGDLLSSKSSSTNPETVYHLDQEANYRKGFRTTHIKVSNDAVVQIVSVFAIGFHSHFNMINGADASITNSNSNFGTFALTAEGFKKEAFEKDNKGFITSIITPRSVVSTEKKIDYLPINSSATSVSKFVIHGKKDESNPPSHIAQGYRIGARVDDKIYVVNNGNTYEATIVMSKGATGSTTGTSFTSEKKFIATHSSPTATNKSIFTIQGGHELQNGESIRIIADNGNLPENIDPHKVYFAITNGGSNTGLTANQIRIASSVSNAENNIFIRSVADVTDQFNIISRVSDKKAGELGHPIQYDGTDWFIHTSTNNNTIFDDAISNGISLDKSDTTYFERREDNRSLDEKIYKLRYVVPKESKNGKDPSDGFVLQDSSSTNVSSNNDFTLEEIEPKDVEFNRNTRFISVASFNSGLKKIFIRTDKPHNMSVGEQVIIKNVKCSLNPSGLDDKSYNGTFIVKDRISSKEFQVSNVDVDGVGHSPGTFNNTTGTRDNQLPRISRNDNKENLFVYRSEVITPYIENVQDGVYHLFVLNANNRAIDPSEEFSEDKYNQNIVNMYPQYDRDNVNDNPPEASSFAKNFPIGDVVTNDLKKSITRETTNNFISGFDVSNTVKKIIDSGTTAQLTFDKEHDFHALKYISPSKLIGGANHEPASGTATYYNVKLLNDADPVSNTNWDGATASVTVENGSVTDATITEGGSGYVDGRTLYFDASDVSTGGIGGGTASARTETETIGISSATNNYVQVTGITTGTDSYHRISGVDSNNIISIHKHSTDTILLGQQVIDMGPVVSVASQIFDATVGITTINTTAAHGLLVGNSFRVLDNNDQNIGDFIVKTVVDVNTFTATTPSSLSSPTYILKHGLSANNASSGAGGENIGVRGLSIYDHEFLENTQQITPALTSIPIRLISSTVEKNIIQRFPLGSYIQVNEEIMRVSKDSLSNNSIEVIRGVLGSRVGTHPVNSRLNKIKPLPIELRRPSILRASGHTFEYVGYGPGNYSTALPQLQNRTLTEREEFLSQAQETSCGNVVYTGMNDKGDFYIGNTKIASASGQQTTFDIPVPTVTGEDPNRLSAVFDEVIIKERLLVEGGSAKNILSQFDGPVTFNGEVRNNDKVTIEGLTKIKNTQGSSTTNTGALVIDGGLGVAENVNASFATGKGFFGNGAGLTNTGATMSTATTGSERVVLTNIFSGTMTDGKTDPQLTFDFATNTLNATNFSGSLQGNVSGNASSSTTSANLSVGDANRVVFKDASNNAATSANLAFDDTSKTLTGVNFLATEVFRADNSSGNNASLGKDGGIELARSDYSVKAGGPYIDFKKLESLNGNAVDMEARIQYDTTSGTNDGSLSFAVITDKSNLPNQSAEAGLTTRLRVMPKDGTTYPGGVKITGDLDVTGDITAFSSSDIRLKENISPIENALNMINSLSGNTFTWKAYNGKQDTGILAQEVEALGLPGITQTRDNGAKAVRYERLIPVLIEAIKELTAKVNTLENK